MHYQFPVNALPPTLAKAVTEFDQKSRAQEIAAIKTLPSVIGLTGKLLNSRKGR